MEKTFVNSLGQKLTFSDDGINFEARNKFCPYEQIDSIGLGAMGIFMVSCKGVTYTFSSDSKDKAELKAIAKSIKETKQSASSTETTSPDRVASAKKDIFSDLLAEAFGALLVIGLVALMCYVLLPNLGGTLSIVINLVVGVVLFAAFLFLIVALVSFLKKTVLQELKGTKTFFNILHILVAILCLLVSGYMVFQYIDGINVGYHSGDYSDYDCYDCNEPADGGLWNGGRFSDDEYYCKKHFEERKELFDKNAGEDDFGHDENNAWTAARDIVEAKLKSPSTAKFCSVTNASIERDGNTWTITGYVDAQNSFGSTLRNNFTVKITFTNSTKYTIDQCSITAK